MNCLTYAFDQFYKDIKMKKKDIEQKLQKLCEVVLSRQVAVKDLKKISEITGTRITLYEWSKGQSKFINNNDHGKDYKNHIKIGLYMQHYFLYEEMQISEKQRKQYNLQRATLSGQIIHKLYKNGSFKRFAQRQYDLSFRYDRSDFTTKSLWYCEDLLKTVYEEKPEKVVEQPRYEIKELLSLKKEQRTLDFLLINKDYRRIATEQEFAFTTEMTAEQAS